MVRDVTSSEMLVAVHILKYHDLMSANMQEQLTFHPQTKSRTETLYMNVDVGVLVRGWRDCAGQMF